MIKLQGKEEILFEYIYIYILSFQKICDNSIQIMRNNPRVTSDKLFNAPVVRSILTKTVLNRGKTIRLCATR